LIDTTTPTARTKAITMKVPALRALRSLFM
jgi:hypothetical protein